MNLYLYLSAVVGLVQVADSIALYRRNGRPGRFANAFSIAEYGWAAISYFVWRSAESTFPFWVPASFIAYVVAMFAGGMIVAAFQGWQLTVVPKHLVLAGGIFGAFFCVACLVGAFGL